MLSIDGTTTVRDMLWACPETFAVLLSRGMCGDCQKNPPPVSLEHFARKHCEGNLEDLLQDLRQVIRKNDPPVKMAEPDGALP